MSVADRLPLADALGGARDGSSGAAQELAGVMREGVREGLAAEGRHVQVLKDVCDMIIGPVGPARYANYEWRGPPFTFDGAPCLHDLQQESNHDGDIGAALNDEVQWASRDVYRVASVDFANVLERVGSMGRGLGAVAHHIDLEPVGRGHWPASVHRA